MSYLALYLLLLPSCFFIAQCNGLISRGRIEELDVALSRGQYLKTAFLGTGRLIVHDLFQLHCPWSWSVATKYRIEEIRQMLGTHGLNHVVLGHLVQADCDDPTMRDKIAYHCYISRTQFWLEKLMDMLVSPIPGVFLAIGFVLSGGKLLVRQPSVARYR
jgi:hypothetical protein